MNIEQRAEQERRIMAAVQAGEFLDLRSGSLDQNHPARGAAWDADRLIDADLLAEILTTAPHEATGRARPVKIRGARIIGSLDLEACTLARPVLLHECYFDDVVNLDEANATVIRLPGCRLPALIARQLRTTGDLELNNGFTATNVDLLGARIAGKLSLSGARLTNPGGTVLNADRITVEQGMFCRDGFTADGEVRLLSARIDGQFDLSGARLTNPGQTALQANWLTVGNYMLCTEGFTAEGTISLASARVAQLNLSGATLTAPGGRALNCHGMAVQRDIDCRGGFTADGEVSLSGAQVTGHVLLDGAHLSNPGKRALYGSALTAGQSLFGRDLTVDGCISLIGARVAGVLDLTGARLRNPGDRALVAIRLIVEGDLICRNGFAADGNIQLSGARIGGQLELDGARLTNPTRQVLSALELTVAQNVFCRDGFAADGEISLVGAHIGGRLSFIDASLSNPQGLALDLELATARALILRPRHTPAGGLDLTNAHVGAFSDEPTTWAPGTLLQGFTYDTLENDHVDTRVRLRRLASQPRGYTPQPYDQLAAAYRQDGREEAARHVAIAKQWQRRNVLNPIGKLTNWLLYLTVGYGYRTWLAAIWLAGLLALGTWQFNHAYPHHITPTEPKPPAFNAFAYTLDLLLPIIDLGQRKAWQAHGTALYLSWTLIAAGWVLTTAVVAGLTSVIKRN